MNILHIASIENDPCDGVCVVVPAHVYHQNEIEHTALLNLCNEHIDGLFNIAFNKPFNIDDLPAPYNNPDIVVFHECYRFDYLGIGVNLRHHKIPYVILPHGELQEEAQHKKYLKKKIANILCWNRFIKGAVAIQCLSERELIKTHFNCRKFVGTNGISIPENRKSSYGGSLDKVTIVYIGRLDIYHKGIDLLISAIDSIKDYLRAHNVSIRMYGPDYFGRADAIRELISESDVGDLIDLNDPITGEDKEKALVNSDLFIQTSRFEGMPMGILEAMSYGIPCLIARGAVLGDLINSYDAGWVADNDSTSIADKIIEAIEDRENWKSKGDNALRLIMENFRWDIIANNEIEHYRDFI